MAKAKLCGDQYIPDQPLPERAEHDRYITPPLECEQAYAMLMHCHPQWTLPRPGKNRHGACRAPFILDPGAGPGIWGTVARRIWPEAVIHGVEMEDQPAPPAYDRYSIGRFPGDHRMTGYDLVVGNPPYNQAETFVREGLKRLRDGGWLMFLLRLQFCTGSKRRDGLYAEHPLYLYGVYSRRISWRADGARKTPPRDHGLFIWNKGYSGPTRMDLIGRPGLPRLDQFFDQKNPETVLAK